jgi:dihydrofolate reductase
MVRISLVVAVADNGVIGANGGLPWRMSSDLKAFRRLTMGKPVVMGRKTFMTLKKPLDGRDNIVVTRDATFAVEGVTAVQSIDDALIIARTLARTSGADEVMVIGGAEIYRAVLPRADRMYWTQVHAAPDGDVVFPPIDPDLWTEVSVEALPRGDRDDHAATLKVLDRRT